MHGAKFEKVKAIAHGKDLILYTLLNSDRLIVRL